MADPGPAGERALARRLAASALCILVAGCVEKGDFGRVKNSTWNDVVAGTGSVAATVRGEPVSGYQFTDDESELRNRAWRFLVPGRDRPWLDRLLAELVATRIVPADLIEPDRHAYHRGLLEAAGRSPVSLYRRLSEDAAADLRLVDPFARVAARVLAADRIRRTVLASAGEVSYGDIFHAQARIAENRCLIAWVAAATAFRVASYRYALDHLVIEAPERDAGPVERTLAALAAERVRLDRLGVPRLAAAACAGGAVPVAPAPGPEPPLAVRG